VFSVIFLLKLPVVSANRCAVHAHVHGIRAIKPRRAVVPCVQSDTCGAAMTTDPGTKMSVIEVPHPDPQTVPPDHSGLAARDVWS
jgi:hypothetical protein